MAKESGKRQAHTGGRKAAVRLAAVGSAIGLAIAGLSAVNFAASAAEQVVTKGNWKVTVVNGDPTAVAGGNSLELWADKQAEKYILEWTGAQGAECGIWARGGTYPVNVVLRDVHCQSPTGDKTWVNGVFRIENGVNVNLELQGSNSLINRGGDLMGTNSRNSGGPGILVMPNSTLTITGSGSLKAQGGQNAAGIGGSGPSEAGIFGAGGAGMDSGTIKINGGHD